VTVFAEAHELLGHFEADETGADDGDAAGGRGGGLEAVHVDERAQGEDAGVVDAGQRRGGAGTAPGARTSLS
jgi:hypothetical protein